MSADIGGMVFFGWLLEDGEIEPNLGDKLLQEEDGEFSDDASQFTTDPIKDPKYCDFYENLVDRIIDEEPLEVIAEGGQDAVKIGVISAENHVSDPISKNDLPCSEMELTSHPGAEWEESNTPKGRSISHGIIYGKSPSSSHLILKLAEYNVVFFGCKMKYSG